MSPDLCQSIELELGEIETLFHVYELLLNLSKIKEPDTIELAALATVLHSFYNGVEKLFVIINKQVDKSPLTSMRWHAELLRQMTMPTELRPAVISNDLYSKLYEYMAFRHYYRHAYSFQLSWEKCAPLVLNIENTMQLLKTEISVFLSKIKNRDFF